MGSALTIVDPPGRTQAWAFQDAAEVAFFNAHQAEFNCYAYAVGDRSNPIDVAGAIPGAAARQPMRNLTLNEMRRALAADGAIPAPEGDAMPPARPGYRLIAAVISPEGRGDFHFYRQMSDGTWTHKPARSPVQFQDAQGRPITDPRTAARDYRNVLINGYRWPLNYQWFAGFYYVPEGGLRTLHGAPPDPPLRLPGAFEHRRLLDWRPSMPMLQGLEPP